MTLIPSLLSLLLFVAGVISARLRSCLLFLFFLVLISAFFIPVFSHQHLSGALSLGLGLIAGAVCAGLILMKASARMFVNVISLILLLSPISFLANKEVRAFLFPPSVEETEGVAKSDTPVIVALFDEFSLNTLLKADLTIDEKRFPNFAAFAAGSSWFRNASCVNQFTPIAVPAILSGRFPNAQKLLPTSINYPGNLFTFLHRSHEILSYEPITKLCPRKICQADFVMPSTRERVRSLLADLAAVYLNYLAPHDIDFGLPDITGKWMDFWESQENKWQKAKFQRPLRVAEVERHIERLSNKKKSNRPTLFFMHAILPHMPHQFIRSGRTYSLRGPRHGYVDNVWQDDSVPIQHGYERYLLQVANADAILGKLVARLKKLGLYEKSLIIVGADHGVSFWPGTYRRGNPEHARFYEDVMLVPLFIKKPYQNEGSVSDLNVQTIDIMPSIIDVLNVNLPWEFDGTSVFGNEARPQKKLIMLGALPVGPDDEAPQTSLGKAGDIVEYPIPAMYPRTTLEWKLKLPGYSPYHESDPFFIGPDADLIGRPVSDFSIKEGPALQVRLAEAIEKEGSAHFVKVQKKSGYLPVRYAGSLQFPAEAPADVEVAIAVNGILRAFSMTSDGENRSKRDVELLVGDASFVEGRNEIQLFFTRHSADGAVTLERIQW